VDALSIRRGGELRNHFNKDPKTFIAAAKIMILMKYKFFWQISAGFLFPQNPQVSPNAQ
jgi:hypothetical protein